MKKITAMILSLTMIISLFNFGVSAEEINAFETDNGMVSYNELYNNVNFKDVQNHWAKDSIYKMSALSIIRGLGNNEFKPDNLIKRDDAVVLLVRLLGYDTEAQQAGLALIQETDTGNHTIITDKDYIRQGYINTALQNGIITQEEVDKITKRTDEGIQNRDDRIEKSMLPYENELNAEGNDLKLTQAQLDNIKLQLQQKDDYAYSWGMPLSREQLAVWIARIKKIEPDYNQQYVYNMKDYTNIETQNIPIIESVLKSGIMNGINGEFRPKDSVTRAQMAKILDEISDEFLTQQGYKVVKGFVDSVHDMKVFENDVETDKEIPVNKMMYVIQMEDETYRNIEVKKSPDKRFEKDFLVYREGKLGLSNLIGGYNYVKYYVDSNGDVKYMRVLNDSENTVEGFLDDLDLENQTLRLRDYNENIFTYNLLSGINGYINNQYVELQQFIYDQEIVLKLRNGKVREIVGYVDMGEEGYIYPKDRVSKGKVLYVKDAENKIVVTDEGKEYEFEVTEFTPIIKSGRNIGIIGIKEGDFLRFEFDEVKGNKPSRIRVSDNTRQVENLYKAKIDRVNLSRDSITLSDVDYFERNKWNDKNIKMNMNISEEVKIYNGGSEIERDDLKDYLYGDAYLASDIKFGKEEIVKIILKNGYEKQFENSINEISFGNSKMLVDYNEVAFDYESTIVVKDGRIVHPYNLEKGNDVTVLAYGSGVPSAAFISIEDIKKTGVSIYRGRIDEIDAYGVELDNLVKIEDTSYETNLPQTAFNLSNDTTILDSRSGTRKITLEKFANSRFLRGKYFVDSYYNKYVYAVAVGDQIIAMNVIGYNTKAQVITIGEVSGLERSDNAIQIKDVRDWSSFNRKWNVNDTNLRLRTSGAMFIKDNKVVDINKVEMGDNLYVLRRNDDGYVIIIR